MSRPIRWVLWLLGLAVVAVAIALAGRHGAGYVVMVIPPWRIELSVMLFVILLIAGFALTYWLVRLAAVAYGMPRHMKKMRAENERAKSRDAVFSSLELLFSGRFRDAEERARAGMLHGETRDLAAALAAWAAYEGGNSGAAVPYLDRIRGEGGDKSANMRDASKAYMLLADGRTHEARELLKNLAESDPRNPGVLKMKVEAEVAEKAWDDVLATLTPLARSGLLPESAAQQIRLNAQMNLIKSKPANREVIIAAWEALDNTSRYDAAMAVTVAKRLAGLGCGDDARRLVEETIDKRGADGWDSSLAAVYADCKGDATLAQIERAEKWLKLHARDAVLLATLGKLCMRQSLWGKAQSYLEASVALAPTLDAHMTLARLMEQMGKRDEAVRHIRRSAELAK
ncbi:MAG: heme biosynthesis HemY N-terminal domain-containing protein [Betaproteobacteria bacterium]